LALALAWLSDSGLGISASASSRWFAVFSSVRFAASGGGAAQFVLRLVTVLQICFSLSLFSASVSSLWISLRSVPCDLLLLIFACGGCSSDLFLSLFSVIMSLSVRYPFIRFRPFSFHFVKFLHLPRVHFGGVG
jgi:hypothetical protein